MSSLFGEGGNLFDPLDLRGSGATAAAKEAAELQSQSAIKGIEEQRRQFDIATGLMQPQIEAGNVARQQQMAMLGLLGPEAQAEAQSQFAESPGQQFIRERQQRALLRNQAAIGGLGGGNVKTALQQQEAGFAAQDFGNQFNRMSSLTGGAQTGSSQLAQQGMGMAGSIGDLLARSGQAQASGVLGAAQSKAQGTQNLMQMAGTALSFFSDPRLKKNIVQIGKMGSLGIYEWEWKDSGYCDVGFMADEVLKEFPECVSKKDGFLIVDYDKAIEEAQKWAA